MNSKLLLWIESVVMALIIALRLGAHVSVDSSPYASRPLVDAYTYWWQTGKLHEGISPFAEGLYQSPAYPWFLNLLSFFWGRPELAGVRAVQSLLGILSCLGLILVGRHLFPRRAWLGALSALIYGLHPHMLMFEQDILTPALSNFLLIFALLLALKPTFARSLACGLFSGVSAVVHPTLLLTVFGFAHLIHSRSGKLLPFFLAFGLSLVPTTATNISNGDFALVSQNSGINFYIGNNPDWKKTSFLPAGLSFRQLALEAEPHKRGLSDRNKYWRDRALMEIADAPVYWLGALGTKLYWSVHSTEIPRNEDYRCRMRQSDLQWFSYLPAVWGICFPFALIGLLLALQGRSKMRPIGLLFLLVHFPMILFLVSDRYRVSVLPFFALLCGPGLLWFKEALSEKKRSVLSFFPLAILPWLPIDERTKIQEDRCLHVEANLALMDNNNELAEEKYRRSLSIQPYNLSARSHLAGIYKSRSEYLLAAEELDEILKHFPDHFPTLRSMARVQAKIKNYSVAAEYMRRAWRVPGDRLSTGIQYLKLLKRSGQKDELSKTLEENPVLREKWLKNINDGGPSR